VFSRTKKNVKRERDESARKKQKRKSRRKTTDKERRCPRKKEAKNETKIHSFSLSLLVVVFGVLP
jgi:hypothetical protein